MAIDINEIKFGVEVEFFGITRSEAASLLEKLFNSRRKTTESMTSEGFPYEEYSIQDNTNGTGCWEIRRDGSINDNEDLWCGREEYKCELVTPILHIKDIGVLEEVIDCLGDNESTINESCGFHIHVDGQIFRKNISKLKNLCNMFYSKQELLFQTLEVHEYRMRYCQKLTIDFINELNQIKSNNIQDVRDIWYGTGVFYYGEKSRYRCLNLDNLLSRTSKKCTVECRIFNSTLDKEVVRAYIYLYLLMVVRAINTKKLLLYMQPKIKYGNKKEAMRIFLVKLGFKGEQFKKSRKILLEKLDEKYIWYNDNF